MNMVSSTKISTLNEKPLHEALKKWYAQPGDKCEVSVDGFVVDIVRGNLFIEIQTRNFSAIKRKLEELVRCHSVRLVYPIPYKKWIVKLSDDGDVHSRRRSPKRGAFDDIFEELIRLPKLLTNANFSMEVLLIEEEEVRRYDGICGWRRRGWVTEERRLLRVVQQRSLNTPSDMVAFLPDTLEEPFSVADVAAAIEKPRRFAQKMVYCLRLMGCVVPVGKRANAVLYGRRRLLAPTNATLIN
jgi:hypothetical protein